MPRKPLGSLLESERFPQQSTKKTLRRTPLHAGATVSYKHEITSKRLQAVEYKQHDDTIYFQPKANSTHAIGYIRLNFGDKEELNIDFLEVYEPFRKKGYGREIYEWVESYAKERGTEKITVISLEEAVGFWRKVGLKRGVWSKPGYLSMAKALCDS